MRLIGFILLLGLAFIPLIHSIKVKHGEQFYLPKLVNIDSDVENLWNHFKKGYGIAFKSAMEDENRFKIFVNNIKLIVKHNLEHDLGKHTYRVGVNKFAAMTNEEFRRKFNGFRKNKNARSLQSHLRRIFAPAAPYLTIPASVDWRNHGLVTPVKDQGQCGSCWTFSASGALEGQHARSSGKLVSLSEQQILDCSAKWGTSGCDGGEMDDAFQYVHDVKGLDTEKMYPYVGEQKSCKFNKKAVASTCSSFVDIPSGNEKALQEAIALQGPIAVAIDASQDSFQFYTSGVYSDPQCSTDNLDHGVLAVGYGTMDDPVNGNQEYYIVKNSWGTSWGDNGYIKMARNQNNMCGISTSASYPIVKDKPTKNDMITH